MFVTDMNRRERVKFAKQAQSLAENSSNLAQALRADDDTQVLLHLTSAALSSSFINELIDVFKDAVVAQVPDSPSTLDIGKDK